MIHSGESGEAVVILANFSERPQTVEPRFLPPTDKGYTDLLSDTQYTPEMLVTSPITLEPYQFLWLRYA
jgi:hypothetical protein